MARRSRVLSGALCLLAVWMLGILPAYPGVHLWRVKEAFSNADGTIQFVELAVCCGSSTEVAIGGKVLTSTLNTFTFPSNVAGPTTNKHILLATAAFAALPGAPAPDHIVVDGFFSPAGDTLTFQVYDTWVFAGVPLDGVTSLNKDPNDGTDTAFTATNSPTNYAGQTGSVVLASGPPAVPDGTGGTTPMTAVPLAADGSSLEIGFDTASCADSAAHHIVYGQASGLPASPGGAFTLMGAVCDIGSSSPYTWLAVPEAGDGTGVLWWLMFTTGGAGEEGSWGVDSALAERVGPEPDGSSGICGFEKVVTNNCGHATP